MTPWGAINDLERRIQAIENYLEQHKFDKLVEKEKAPPVSAGEPSFDDKVDDILEKYGLRNYPDI